jgi:glyoxylase-like metal-dependent hydrolase (beta-lactamase superfamily II)
MKEVLPGIFQMTLTLSGFNPNSVNIYLIRTGNYFTIVDTGWEFPAAIKSMENQLAEIGARFTDIKQILITHFHIDHLGMMAKFKGSHDVKIYLPQNEIELLKIRYTGGDNYLPLTDKFLQNHGFPAAELTPPEFRLPIPENLVSTKIDVLLRGGEEIRAGEYVFKVVNTPGHTPGHVGYYEPSHKFIISGDMLLPTIATNAAFHVQHMRNPLQQYLSSLRILRELDINLILPGHEYIFSNHRQRIDELIRHHQEKAAEIWQVLADRQPRTAYAISRVLSWSPQSKTTVWDNLSGWDKRFAVLQTIAHLEERVYANQLTGFSEDGKLYYR